MQVHYNKQEITKHFLSQAAVESLSHDKLTGVALQAMGSYIDAHVMPSSREHAYLFLTRCTNSTHT